MTRDEFEQAVRVAREGRRAHSFYAVEDARAALRPVAQYQWRQTAITAFCLMLGSMMAPKALPTWPWFTACLTGGMAGYLFAWLVMTATPLRPFFAPAGLRAGDVANAFSALHAPT